MRTAEVRHKEAENTERDEPLCRQQRLRPQLHLPITAALFSVALTALLVGVEDGIDSISDGGNEDGEDGQQDRNGDSQGSVLTDGKLKNQQ